jgi:hypothetical protein
MKSPLPEEGRGQIAEFARNSSNFPTHNPTHSIRCLVRLTGILAVPACL